jgi:hypothetical protein
MKNKGLIKCGWRDSNPHALRHQILSLARLPITPHPHVTLKRNKNEGGDTNYAPRRIGTGDTNYTTSASSCKKGAQIYRLFADPITLFNKIEFSIKMGLIR